MMMMIMIMIMICIHSYIVFSPSLFILSCLDVFLINQLGVRMAPAGGSTARVTHCVWVVASRVLWHIAEHKHSSGSGPMLQRFPNGFWNGMSSGSLRCGLNASAH